MTEICLVLAMLFLVATGQHADITSHAWWSGIWIGLTTGLIVALTWKYDYESLKQKTDD